MADLRWPAENARLLQINAPGTQDDYGDVASAGGVLWNGDVGAALTRDRSASANRDRAGETQSVMETIEGDVLVVRKPPAGITAITITPGDQQSAHTVLVEDRRVTPAVRRRWHVVGVAYRARGAESDSLRLVLRDPR